MKLHRLWALTVLAMFIAVHVATSAQAQSYSVLYSFRGTHGTHPYAGLIRDKKGNLYGTTYGGGASNSRPRHGTIFKLKADGTEKVLHSFTGLDGSRPYTPGLAPDAAGNLYGTTEWGGSHNHGVVFKLDTSGGYSVLHSFVRAGGVNPLAGLVQDAAGNLYGTTLGGGAYNQGVVFKLNATGVYTVLYSFTGGADGANPAGNLVRDSHANLYGTTIGGGHGWGTVFKLTANAREKVLHSFTQADGEVPDGGLVRDSAGTLYGTTEYGGDYGYGVVFKLDMSDAYTMLYSFTGGTDGARPGSGVVRDAAGNLYGATELGGAYGAGVVFKLDTSAYSVLHSFDGVNGGIPYGRLMVDAVGKLYGTATVGGSHLKGVVFRITPQ